MMMKFVVGILFDGFKKKCNWCTLLSATHLSAYVKFEAKWWILCRPIFLSKPLICL